MTIATPSKKLVGSTPRSCARAAATLRRIQNPLYRHSGHAQLTGNLAHATPSLRSRRLIAVYNQMRAAP